MSILYLVYVNIISIFNPNLHQEIGSYLTQILSKKLLIIFLSWLVTFYILFTLMTFSTFKKICHFIFDKPN